MITFSDTVTYIGNQADTTDLGLLEAAAKQRRAALATERAQTLEAGAEVRLGRFAHKDLNNLLGTVVSVDRSRETVLVELDESSTYILRGSRKYGRDIPHGASKHTLSLPAWGVFTR